MFCKNCGKEMDENSNYCPNCGAVLNAKAETAVFERTGTYAPYDASETAYNRAAARKETPVRGSLSIFPIFGIMGVVFMVITLAVTFYSDSMIDGLQKNLSQYYNEMNDGSLINQISGPVIDFFTGGARTQKLEDINNMAQDLVKGRDLMSASLLCALLSVFTSLAGVLRNIKKPAAGRVLFIFAYIFALGAGVLVVIACTMLYLINTLLIITVTASLLAFIMLVVEARRVKIIKSVFNSYPRKRSVPVNTSRM